MSSLKTVLDHVLDHAVRAPERTCVQVVSARGKDERLSFEDVAAGAARAAGFFSARGVRRGDVVVLLGTHHPDLYACWLGAVWLGAIPTVLAEPSVRIDRGVYVARLGVLLERIQARVIAHDPGLSGAFPSGPLVHAGYDVIASSDDPAPARISPEEDDVLLLQHSSGTTGLQKGVMLSHGAVMRHAEAYGRAIDLRVDDVIASWLPLYHDMGFIACFVDALIAGTPVVWLSPFEWVASPSLLLSVIVEYRATLVWLPNFAFTFLSQRVREPSRRFDLSSLRSVVNCSEPVSAESIDRFVARFAPHGLRSTAVQACYAMAENVFAVTTTTERHPPRRLRVDRSAWSGEHRAVPVAEGQGLVHVSSGVPVEGCTVRIVDEQRQPLPVFSAGHILIKSPFLFSGYFRNPDENTGLFDGDGFFDSGDLGYLDDHGHLYVAGRRKDLVIVGGRNVYPQDIEEAVGDVAGLHAGRVVCFGVPMAALDTEGLVVLAESDASESGWPEVARRIRAVVPARLDLDLLDARVVPRGELRKSTSGKLARSGNREWYLAGRFGAVPAAVRGERS